MQSIWVRCIIAILAVAVALAARWLLDPLLDDRSPLMILLLGVVIASALGGLWPGLLATLLSAVAADYFFIAPRFVFVWTTPENLQIIVYVVLGIGLSVVGELYRRNRIRAARADAELRRHQAELEQIITQRTEALNRSNEQLRRTETLAALGALSSGISHDLSNLLLPMEGQIELAMREDLPPQTRERLESIKKTVGYMRDLSRRLRHYMQTSRDPTRAAALLEDLCLDHWCRETEPFLKSVIPPNVAFVCKIASDMPTIQVSKAALTQAIYNLVQNAGQIITESKIGSTVDLRAEPLSDKVRLIVEDDGPGMTPEVCQRCLDPFFTTGERAAGGGTGIGLSLVKGFVESCGGTIEVHSPPAPDKPRGTAFVLTIPRTCR